AKSTLKQPVPFRSRDTGPVIPDNQDHLVSVRNGRNLQRGHLVAPISHCIVEEIVEHLLQHGICKNLKTPGIVLQPYRVQVQLGQCHSDHSIHILPYGRFHTKLLVLTGKFDLFPHCLNGPLFKIQVLFLDRICCQFTDQLDITADCHQLVVEVVPGDTCQEVDIPVRTGKCQFCLFAFSHVPEQ